MPNIVQITVKTKAEDLLRFMLFHAFSKPSGLLTLSASIVSLVCLPFSLFLWKDQFVSLALALLVFIYLILTPLNMYSQSRRQVGSNPVFKNVITFHISEEIFEVQQYTGTLRLYWPQLVKIKVTPFDYLFYVNEEQAFIVPKKAVSAEDFTTLNNIIELVKKDLNQEPIKPDENFKYKSKTKENKTVGLEKQLKEVAIKEAAIREESNKESNKETNKESNKESNKETKKETNKETEKEIDIVTNKEDSNSEDSNKEDSNIEGSEQNKGLISAPQNTKKTTKGSSNRRKNRSSSNANKSKV